MNGDFTVPFVALVLSFSWIACVSAACKRNRDYIELYDTIIYKVLNLGVGLSIIAGLVMSLINAGFLVFLGYLGICVGAILIAQFTTSAVLVALLGYKGIAGILSILCGVSSAIWMFSNIGSLR